MGAGFGLVRRKPLAVLAWGLIVTLAFCVVLAAYAAFVLNIINVSTAEKAGGHASASETSAFFGVMLMSQGGIFLAIVVLILLQTIVTTAVWRSVLHPEQDRWAYLRVGMAELFVFLMNIAMGFIANLVAFPLMPFFILVGALIAFHQYVAAIFVGVFSAATAIAAAVYLRLRFALLGPMIADDSKFHFVDAWRLSRGNVGRLFVVGLCLVGIALAAEAAIGGLLFVSGALALGVAAGGFEKLPGFVQHSPQLAASELWPLAALWVVAALPIAGSLSAIMLAPWATAYRHLAPKIRGG